MFHLKPRIFSGFVSVGLLALGVTTVQAGTCGGRSVTMNITQLSQLTNIGFRTYEVVGTTGNDTIRIDLQNMKGSGQNTNTIKVILTDSDVKGGTDYVCVDSDVDYLRVRGGSYLKSRNVTWVEVKGLEDSAIVDLDSPGWVETGNGNNLVVIDSDGGRSRVIGGKGNDTVIISTSGDAIVETKDGDDTINIKLLKDESTAAVNGGSGDDWILIETDSTEGKSFVVGGPGEDLIETGDGKDLVYGSDVRYSDKGFSWKETESTWITSIDDFYGAATAFKISTTTEVDYPLHSYLTALHEEDTSGGEISTNGGHDYISGTDGTDYLHGGDGNDHIYGEGARDRLWGENGNDRLYGGDGNDDVYGGRGNDTMYGDAGNDLMKGGTGDDVIKGGSGNDTLFGNQDDDTIDGESGKDECSGDSGKDEISHC